MKPEPRYISSISMEVLKKRVQAAYEMMEHCHGCAWRCGVNRIKGQFGKCRTGFRARVSSYGPHFGEERPLSGWRGSGTIFFTRCNLMCQYCQNHDISQTPSGEEIEPEGLAALMLKLQNMGCHNINLVSPSHVVAPILAAIAIAAASGLHLPIIYNTGGYDSLESLSMLDSVIDIYMPDMKYDDAEIAQRYSLIPDYPYANRNAVKEMHRQVGDLKINQEGLAVSGLLIRHLVLPNQLAGTAGIMQFIANEISIHTYVNIMDQYRPEYKGHLLPELNRPITTAEYQEAIQMAKKAGLYRLD